MPLSLDFSARFWSNRVMTNRTSPANQFISHTPHTHAVPTQSVEIVPACLGRDVSRRHDDDDTLTIILLACLLSVECDCAVLGKRQEASGKAARRQGFYLLGLAETLRCAPQPFGRPL